MNILITGAAGFIGMHLCVALCKRSVNVVGIDNLNSYYDRRLKVARLMELKAAQNFYFEELDINEVKKIDELFAARSFDCVIHLAAQAGVRYSIDQPLSYAHANQVGFLGVIEACRNHNIKHFMYASSSSVYGRNQKMPLSEDDRVDLPASLYAATKRGNELVAEAYSDLYGLPSTGLRFFTAYGPWGRPDMAYFSFTQNILEGKSINVYNNGQNYRDFTYIDDIIHGIVGLVDLIPGSNEAPPNFHDVSRHQSSLNRKHRILNIGNGKSVSLEVFISEIEKSLGKKAKKTYLPAQPGDVVATYSDISKLESLIGCLPHTSLEVGILNFTQWFTGCYQKLISRPL